MGGNEGEIRTDEGLPLDKEEESSIQHDKNQENCVIACGFPFQFKKT